ncbi:unnamed protein product, partial [Amoebophrya sp. A120]|eukprot:GSA120T00024234001.1
MKDQVDALRKKNIPAVALHGDLSWSEERQFLQTLERFATSAPSASTAAANAPCLLYVSPEKLVNALERTQNSSFISLAEMLTLLFQNNKLGSFVIDEAHCVSE